MANIIPIYKPVGKTPLEMINLLKKRHKEYREEKVSYAGRLDPMAEGILLLLIGEENKKRRSFEELPKMYESEIVFGITTDSYDTLGIVGHVKRKKINDETAIEKILQGFRGKTFQKFPPYSSKTVSGKPLYWWARRNRLSEIEIPKKNIEIFDIKILKTTSISGKQLAEIANKRTKILKGEFRQGEIEASWKIFEDKYHNENFKVIKIIVKCSGGTYIRQLASDLGEALETGALALSIIRTRVGKYTLSDCLKM